MLAKVTDDHVIRASRMIGCGLDVDQVSQWLATHDADKAEVERLRAVILDVFSYEPSHIRRERGSFGLDTIGNSLNPSNASRATIIRVLKATEAESGVR